jgi:hypothetical protein
MNKGTVIALFAVTYVSIVESANAAPPSITISFNGSGCALYHGPCNALPTFTETSATAPMLSPPTQTISAPPGYGTTATASLTASVAFNKVTWSGKATAMEPTTQSSPVGAPDYEASAGLSFSATALDTLIVTPTKLPDGTVLPNGSPVQVVITVTNFGSYECTGGYTPNEVGFVSIQVALANSGYSWNPLSQDCGSASLNAQKQFMFSATVGQSVPLQFSVETDLVAYSANQDPGSASWDPPGNGLNIDSMTPGAILVATSGTNYSSATSNTSATDGPLPLWALGALGAGLVWIASRQIKKMA